MSRNESLQEHIDYLQELLDEDNYYIDGYCITLLVKDKSNKSTGYVVNYEAEEFLKLIAVLEIAKNRVLNDADSRVTLDAPAVSDSHEHDGPESLQ